MYLLMAFSKQAKHTVADFMKYLQGILQVNEIPYDLTFDRLGALRIAPQQLEHNKMVMWEILVRDVFINVERGKLHIPNDIKEWLRKHVAHEVWVLTLPNAK
jgi:hypothetical protein